MSIYLATFGKLRYLGLLNLTDGLDAETEAANDQALLGTRWVLLQTMRGLEMGSIAGRLTPEQAQALTQTCFQETSNTERLKGPEPMLQDVDFAGFAEESDIDEHHRCRADEEAILRRAREILVTNHKLEMKLVDTEYMLDRRKLFFYFTSEQRIDFRAYVRDLAREFRTRIEMRQIGVRDESRVVEGISPCGRPCCCSYWLHQFLPIGIRMVKEQKLALNPTKISGICGRLMCCMAYEHENYEELWRNLPGPGAKIRAPQGTYVLDSVDLGTEQVRIKYPAGQIVAVPISEFQDFQDSVMRGEEPEGPRNSRVGHSVLPVSSRVTRDSGVSRGGGRARPFVPANAAASNGDRDIQRERESDNDADAGLLQDRAFSPRRDRASRTSRFLLPNRRAKPDSSDVLKDAQFRPDTSNEISVSEQRGQRSSLRGERDEHRKTASVKKVTGRGGRREILKAGDRQENPDRPYKADKVSLDEHLAIRKHDQDGEYAVRQDRLSVGRVASRKAEIRPSRTKRGKPTPRSFRERNEAAPCSELGRHQQMSVDFYPDQELFDRSELFERDCEPEGERVDRDRPRKSRRQRQHDARVGRAAPRKLESSEKQNSEQESVEHERENPKRMRSRRSRSWNDFHEHNVQGKPREL